MVKKEIISITISGDTGALFFDGDDNTLRDTGGIKFIYDPKNDAELLRTLCFTVNRKMHELFYDGILAKIDIPLGDIDIDSSDYKRLEKSHELVDVLSPGKSNRLDIRIEGKKSYISTNEDGSNFFYANCIDNPQTLMGRLIKFTNSMNVSKKRSRQSNKIKKLINQIESIVENPLNKK